MIIVRRTQDRIGSTVNKSPDSPPIFDNPLYFRVAYELSRRDRSWCSSRGAVTVSWIAPPLNCSTGYRPMATNECLAWPSHAFHSGIFIFPVQLTTSRIGNLTRLIHTLLYVMTIHPSIHTYTYVIHVVD